MPADRAALTERLTAFIREIAAVAADDRDFGPEVDLFDYGYLDSFGVVQLIEMVQREFGPDLTQTDFYGENIRSIRAIAAHVAAKAG